ncbi:hydratase [Hydrogenophaga crassostreae]|uniref:Hydratase n=1 Tax=Hydrogenophaga crassostreae TaxID=1763535 RepID=A0A167IIC7_9BURK|nr:fumarylacetoacetate hydrolase family protein [Hydrogenophaga crassostreae]AOW14201.1 hydratase [Hydrogenophaga crassostreae]OAD42870.1 hydratase [Hydrogenophaga crassostreae]
MTPQDILIHLDQGRLWPAPITANADFDLPAGYALALQVRGLRMARGEVPRGYKVGFTNRTIWPRYNVFAPIWGTVWNSTLSFCDGTGEMGLSATCQPRLEPEVVFGLKATPAPDASLQDLFNAIDWVAPGFEVVQSHLPDWKFLPADTVADGALHARLLVGSRIPARELAIDAIALDALLAQASTTLSRDGETVDSGVGANVLDSPLRALLDFVQTLRCCPGAPDLQAGDVVTTGTWTDAWPIAPGQKWTARFTLPGFELTAHFKE